MSSAGCNYISNPCAGEINTGADKMRMAERRTHPKERSGNVLIISTFATLTDGFRGLKRGPSFFSEHGWKLNHS